MFRRLGWIAVLALVGVCVATPAFAQGGSTATSINGVVKDKDGLVPGATVELVNVATGEKFAPVVTNADGAYSFPGVAAGKYKVTISMQNYKKVETEVTVLSG
ncbi:MAG TPA: carboxypeptidase-like regulatory domain-containing protein, partial [Vicinamibacterales bacterium]|nr:carboxypeptidase-like regulatory domain-containing protein [Vicinamibacterales bacterium]